MEKSFEVTQKTNVEIIKVLKILILVTIGYAIVTYLKYSEIKHSFLIILLFIGSFLFILITKKYKIIGNLTIDLNHIGIKSDSTKVIYSFENIDRIKVYIYGYCGKNYFPTLFQPIGVNCHDGSDNVLEIESDNKVHKVEFLLKKEKDIKDLKLIIDELRNKGVNIEKVVLPSIKSDL